MVPEVTIAVDGHSSTGKSTLARQLANKLGYRYVDSGAMYRAVTFYALRNNLFSPVLDKEKLIGALDSINVSFEFNAETERSEIVLNGENVEKQIRQMEISNKVSEVAAVPEVRKKLVAMQQDMGRQGGVVMDGRDIGTVVFPHAELKIFMTARKAVRVDRRYQELTARGEKITREEVEANLMQRDLLDSTREDSPLKKAENARVLDNSDISTEEQLRLVYGWTQEVIAAGS